MIHYSKIIYVYSYFQEYNTFMYVFPITENHYKLFHEITIFSSTPNYLLNIIIHYSFLYRMTINLNFKAGFIANNHLLYLSFLTYTYKHIYVYLFPNGCRVVKTFEKI